MSGSEWFADRPGGLNRYFAELYTALRSHEGVSVEAAAFGTPPEGGRTWGPIGMPLLGRVFRSRRVVAGVSKDAGPDVVDRHFCLYGGRGGKFRGSRPLSVVHFHGPWATESLATGRRGPSTFVKKVIERRRYRSADLVVVLSEAFKRVVVDDYGVREDRVRVIPPGVRSVAITSSAEEQVPTEVTTAGRTVLCVRRLERRMGIDVLLEGWQRVLSAVPDAELVIVGDGSERDALEAQAIPFGGTVRFLGKIPDEELARAYRRCTVTVIPSRSLEGFGLIALESLAHGKAPVLTACGGLPDSVRGLDESLIVEPESVEALASRLISALQGDRPSADACLAHASTFSWESAVARHIDTYREFLD